MKFTKKRADEILYNQIDSKILVQEYPEFVEIVTKEFSTINENSNQEDIMNIINLHKSKAKFAIDKINKSGKSLNAMNTFLPDIIKARIAIYMLEQFYHAAKTAKDSDKPAKTRLGYWDGMLLQKMLFQKDLVRKPASLFWFRIVWRMIRDKNLLMPLVNERGIYCFYTKELIRKLSELSGNTTCLEIAAGDGTLTRFLREKGINCLATDDYSWEHYIKYPEFVEKLEAGDALKKYQPETVISSWTPPNNTFEKHIFQTDSVNTYVVIGSKNHLGSGNQEVYQNQDSFHMEYSEELSGLIIPPSQNNAVYIFRRKNQKN